MPIHLGFNSGKSIGYLERLRQAHTLLDAPFRMSFLGLFCYFWHGCFFLFGFGFGFPERSARAGLGLLEALLFFKVFLALLLGEFEAILEFLGVDSCFLDAFKFPEVEGGLEIREGESGGGCIGVGEDNFFGLGCSVDR